MSTNKKPVVLITHPEVPQPGIDLLRTICDIKMCTKLPPQRNEILEKCRGVDALYWADHTALNSEVLNTVGQQLKVISTMSAGIDYVDIPEVKSRGIPLGHTPGVLTEAVAELAIGLLLAASRRFHEGRQKIETSNWENWHLQWMLGKDIRGSTVGFIGFGNISKGIAERLKGFNIGRIIYTCHHPKNNDLNATYVNFDELLKDSDFIFVVCPLTSETENLLNEDAFNKMKSNCVLINVARGKIVDQTALYNALKNNQIFAAGLDVTDPEPISADDPLLTLPNCVVIPHLGSATKRTRVEMSLLAAQNILNGLAGKRLLAPAY